MERKAHYALIGLFTFAVVAGAFGFIFWLHHSSGKKQAVAYRVIFDSYGVRAAGRRKRSVQRNSSRRGHQSATRSR